MQKKKKEIDFRTKNIISKVANRSKRVKNLAATPYICVVFETEKSFKELIVETKNA